MSDYREHIENSKKSIVSFSGGKDSTAMLLMMLERGMKIDYILFCDTGMEFPQMYEHIERVNSYIGEKYGKMVTVLKPSNGFEYGLLHILRKRGKRAGTHGYGWSSMNNRWCTYTLKREPVSKFMKEHGFTKANTKMYIGIAADEPKRVHSDIYPLFEWGITEAQALQYCYKHGFDWGAVQRAHTAFMLGLPNARCERLKALVPRFPRFVERIKAIKPRSDKEHSVARR